MESGTTQAEVADFAVLTTYADKGRSRKGAEEWEWLIQVILCDTYFKRNVPPLPPSGKGWLPRESRRRTEEERGKPGEYYPLSHFIMSI